MGWGQLEQVLQHAKETARWSQIYGILGSNNPTNPESILTPEVRKALDAAYFSDTSRSFSGDSFFGFLIFIMSGVGLLLACRERKALKIEPSQLT
jgi:hypothetical protein